VLQEGGGGIAKYLFSDVFLFEAKAGLPTQTEKIP
jgi:hypothetical protein